MTDSFCFVRRLAGLLLLGAIFATAEAEAQFGRTSRSFSSSSSSSSNYTYLGVGVFNHDAGVASIDAVSASKPTWGQTYTQMSLTGWIQLTDDWSFAPVATYAFPNKTTPENKETTNAKAFSLNAHWSAWEGLDFHFGPGVVYYQIKGTGETQSLNNGSGTTTFGTPSETRTSTLVCLDVGTGYQIDRYRLDASVLVTGLTSSSKRAVNAVLTLSMGVF